MPSIASTGKKKRAGAGEMKYLADLPPGYDDRTRIALRDDNQVIATHPEHPALVLLSSGEWHDLGAQRLRQAADAAITQP